LEWHHVDDDNDDDEEEEDTMDASCLSLDLAVVVAAATTTTTTTGQSRIRSRGNQEDHNNNNDDDEDEESLSVLSSSHVSSSTSPHRSSAYLKHGSVDHKHRALRRTRTYKEEVPQQQQQQQQHASASSLHRHNNNNSSYNNSSYNNSRSGWHQSVPEGVVAVTSPPPPPPPPKHSSSKMLHAKNDHESPPQQPSSSSSSPPSGEPISPRPRTTSDKADHQYRRSPPPPSSSFSSPIKKERKEKTSSSSLLLLRLDQSLSALPGGGGDHAPLQSTGDKSTGRERSKHRHRSDTSKASWATTGEQQPAANRNTTSDKSVDQSVEMSPERSKHHHHDNSHYHHRHHHHHHRRPHHRSTKDVTGVKRTKSADIVLPGTGPDAEAQPLVSPRPKLKTSLSVSTFRTPSASRKKSVRSLLLSKMNAEQEEEEEEDDEKNEKTRTAPLPGADISYDGSVVVKETTVITGTPTKRSSKGSSKSYTTSDSVHSKHRSSKSPEKSLKSPETSKSSRTRSGDKKTLFQSPSPSKKKGVTTMLSPPKMDYEQGASETSEAAVKVKAGQPEESDKLMVGTTPNESGASKETKKEALADISETAAVNTAGGTALRKATTASDPEAAVSDVVEEPQPAGSRPSTPVTPKRAPKSPMRRLRRLGGAIVGIGSGPPLSNKEEEKEEKEDIPEEPAHHKSADLETIWVRSHPADRNADKDDGESNDDDYSGSECKHIELNIFQLLGHDPEDAVPEPEAPKPSRRRSLLLGGGR